MSDKRRTLNSLEYEALPNSYQRDLECEVGKEVENTQSFTEALWKQDTVMHKGVVGIASLAGILGMVLLILSTMQPKEVFSVQGAAWASKALPFSTVDPTSLGFIGVDRPYISKPGPIFGDLLTREIPLPTNSWYENFLLGQSNVDPENKVFQVPYVLDTAGPIPGVRTHSTHVQASNRAIMMTYELASGLTLGATETFAKQHTIHSQGSPAISKLAIELQWQEHLPKGSPSDPVAKMRSPIVRGAPYTSMLYFHATPRIYAERHVSAPVLIDNKKVLLCGQQVGEYSATPVRAEKEIRLQFDTSDMTWIIFLSEPMYFTCSNFDAVKDDERLGIHYAPGVVSKKVSFFDLKAMGAVKRGMVRIAMANNCTTGQNPENCGGIKTGPKDQSAYETLLRKHADAYPSAKADVQFTFPVESEVEEELRLLFNWRPKYMSDLALLEDYDGYELKDVNHPTKPELLMFALPHHQERMRPVDGSSNTVQTSGCIPTIHGQTCPALGSAWSLVEHLHRTSFIAPRPPREEMLPDMIAAAKEDLKWRIPANYMVGAGDTYFSGKLLARMARVLLISEEIGLSTTPEFTEAMNHFRSGVEIWLNGSAQSMFLYDQSWHGLVMCGCDYAYENHVGFCRNKFPNCPALEDQGQNFGAGFYNDHHYHFGYHIYSAAVLSKFDPVWGRKFHQHVLLLIRDIANPSDDDSFFPLWRHKDWYLGFSWASGVVTINNKPYPNGRNQESVSEAIAAYEAVAMYGEVMHNAFLGSADLNEMALFETAGRIRDLGRLLMATEIRSAKTYWHVQAPGTPGVSRIYPDVYEPKNVGMIWSMLAQEQTWFGNEPWKSYGIQLLPITPAAELRDDPSWMTEMLPVFQKSCFDDHICVEQGWSIIIYTSMATTGRWQEAWEGVKALDRDVYESAGGNGHSETNTLWYIATRPDV